MTLTQLTGVAETDLLILKYLDAKQIIPILESNNKNIISLIFDVIRLYKKDDLKYLSKLLIWSNENKNKDFSEYLAEFGADIHLGEYLTNKGEYKDKNDEQAFQNAVLNGHIEVVKLLIERGIDIRVDNDNALRTASKFEIVKLLVDNGANIHANDNEALQLAVENGHIEVVKYLVGQGANIHRNDDEPLQLAVWYGYIEIVRFLLERGANIYANDDKAFINAIEYGYYNILKLLVKYIKED